MTRQRRAVTGAMAGTYHRALLCIMIQHVIQALPRGIHWHGARITVPRCGGARRMRRAVRLADVKAAQSAATGTAANQLTLHVLAGWTIEGTPFHLCRSAHPPWAAAAETTTSSVAAATPTLARPRVLTAMQLQL